MASTEISALRTIILIAIISPLIVNSYTIANRKLCGRVLADTLGDICGSIFNPFVRRTKNSAQFYKDDVINNDKILPLDSQFLNKFRGAIIPKVRRRRRGVSDECCRKPCTLRELSSYCQTPIL